SGFVHLLFFPRSQRQPTQRSCRHNGASGAGGSARSPLKVLGVSDIEFLGVEKRGRTAWDAAPFSHHGISLLMASGGAVGGFCMGRRRTPSLPRPVISA